MDLITTEPASTLRQDLLPQHGTVPKEVVNKDKDTEPREKRRDLPPHAGAVTKKQKEDNPPEVSEVTAFPPDIFGSQLTIPLLSTTAKEPQAEKPSLVSASYDESDTDDKEKKNQRPGVRTEDKAKAQRNGKTANYQGPRKPRRNGRQGRQQHWTKFEAFNNMFGGEQDWQIYLIITTEIRIHHTQLERRLLEIHPSEEMSVRKIRNEENKFLIETTSKEQSRTYLSLTNIKGLKVTVEKHGELNSVWGSVIIWDLDDNDEETYKDILRYRYKNVEEVQLTKILRKNKKNLDILRIKFSGDRLPDKIYLEGTVKEVRPHLPRPTQCYKCLEFGHVSRYCENDTARCFKCGSPDHDPRNTRCPNQEKCFNCKGEHHARSNKCEFYNYYTQVKHLQVRSGMTAREAKITLKAKGINDPYVRPTYRQTMRNEDTTRSEGKTNPKEKTPERSPKHLEHQAIGRADTTSPFKNRFSPLEDAEDIDFWTVSPQGVHPLEDPSKKRQREDSPTQNKISQKKTNRRVSDTLSETEMETTQEFTPERQNTKSPRQMTRSLSDGLDKTGSPKNRKSNANAHRSQTEISESNDMLGIRVEMEKYKKALASEKKSSNDLHKMEIEASIHATQGSSSPINDEETIRRRQQKEDETAAEGFWETKNNPNLISLEPITPSPLTSQQRKEYNLTQKDAKTKQSETEAKAATPGKGKDLQLEGLKIHRTNCGCHSCFMEVMSKMEGVTKAKVKETVDLFRKQKNPPKTHITPANKCKCVTHLNIKCGEHTWLEKLYEETKVKEEQRKQAKANWKPPRGSSRKNARKHHGY